MAAIDLTGALWELFGMGVGLTALLSMLAAYALVLTKVVTCKNTVYRAMYVASWAGLSVCTFLTSYWAWFVVPALIIGCGMVCLARKRPHLFS